MVSFFRGIASAPGTPFRGMEDPVAKDLLPRPLALGLAAVESSPLFIPAMRLLSVGLVDHVSLRTAAIDDELGRALARGARQLVVLGAGLDSRAYRMNVLDGVRVFEVDHPATQADKTRRLRGRKPRAADVKFLAVDFERDSLEVELARGGHDETAPTAWIWEGVTPYLAKSAIESTLAVASSRSAPSSTMIATYLTPEMVSVPHVPRALLRAGFFALGEPIRHSMTSLEARVLFADHGFDVEADSGSEEWARRFLVGDRSLIGISERLAVAVRGEREPRSMRRQAR
jgi:methyltransferase (TIGR00027 family)